MTRQSQTEILKQLLPVAAPGGHDEALDDTAIYGPRGGLRGYERAPGAKRLGVSVVTRVLGDEAIAATVRHGHSYFYEHGFAGKYAQVHDTGPTFAAEDIAAVGASIDAARARTPEVLALLNGGDVRAAVAKAVELSEEDHDEDEDDEDQALGQ